MPVSPPMAEPVPKPEPDAETTSDRLLDGKVHLVQPARGYRVAVDPVLLAAAVPARQGERVLDIGTGVGAAALCLAARVAGTTVVGVEVQPDLAVLARSNATVNGMADRFTVVESDIARFATDGAFDHVMANPPFAELDAGTPPPDSSKRAANVQSTASLATWVFQALRSARDGGTITFIHRADRLAELLQGLGPQGLGLGVVVFPLWPRAGAGCKRLIVQAQRGSRAPLRLAAGLVLHEADGIYTAAAQTVLRGGAALDV